MRIPSDHLDKNKPCQSRFELEVGVQPSKTVPRDVPPDDSFAVMYTDTEEQARATRMS